MLNLRKFTAGVLAHTHLSSRFFHAPVNTGERELFIPQQAALVFLGLDLFMRCLNRNNNGAAMLGLGIACSALIHFNIEMNKLINGISSPREPNYM